jgi:hypothetical protein
MGDMICEAAKSGECTAGKGRCVAAKPHDCDNHRDCPDPFFCGHVQRKVCCVVSE